MFHYYNIIEAIIISTTSNDLNYRKVMYIYEIEVKYYWEKKKEN